MNEIEANVSDILKDRKRLECLLMLEKERRGVSQDTLVFVGTANVAKHWWCTQQTVLHSRATELDVFKAYFSDRIVYAHRLGLISKLPTSHRAMLDVGNEINFADVEQLLQEEADKMADCARRSAGVHSSWIYEEKKDSDGKRSWLLNPDLPPEEKRGWEELAIKQGIRVINLEEDPMRRGEIYEALRAEKHPTIRWHFPWRHYSVGGVPDGLTEEFAYEYKTTRNRYLFPFMKPIAFAQADLYAYFFRRPKKRVQILIVEDDVTETYEEPADAVRAEVALAAFARVDAGEPAIPPLPWKCKKCDFRATCPISQAK